MRDLSTHPWGLARRGALVPALILWLAAAGILSFQSAAWAAEGPVTSGTLTKATELTLPGALGQPQAAEEVTIPPSMERRRQAALRELLAPQPTAAPLLRVRALEGYLDYNDEDQMVYSPSRTRIVYGKFLVEADKLILDARLQEVQADGDVELKVDQDVIHADSIRYNFQKSEGVAFNVRGSHGNVYFKSSLKPEAGKQGPPQMQKVSKNESIFRNTQVTACDFKIPHYYVKAREVVLFEKDRIFLRGATFYVAGMPVLYLPAFSRSLYESSPWFVQLGYGSRTGGRVRLGYSYQHRTEEPSLTGDGKMEVRSAGKADVYLDYLTKIGPGAGFDYTYQAEYGKHRGELSLYSASDSDRQVAGTTVDNDSLSDESKRWRIAWKHRTEVTPDLTALVNIDYFSDPDIFYDILDFYSEDLDQRDRQIERRGRVALTWVREAYVARIMADVKDRVGLSRYNDYSNPRTDDRDYDIEPGSKLKDTDADGISSKRWGRVATKAPQLDFSTRWLPVAGRPLYYNGEAHLYNSLDRGVNTVSHADNAYVQGVEAYQSLMQQWKLSQRYILLAKLGFGMGGAARDTDDLGADFHDDDFPHRVDALEFVDGNTFLVGRHRRSLDDIRPFYAWGDSEVKLNARFSDALTGFLRWRFRETVSDFIGDWYASIGHPTFREDLYNYKIREHWLEGNLNYRLARPLINLYTQAGLNLESKSDLYSKEPVAYWRNGVNWTNQRRTLVAGANIGIRRRQYYDPSDPDEYQENKVSGALNLSYSPIHQRWYTRVDANFDKSLNGHVDKAYDNDYTYFSDEEPNLNMNWTYGRELGPKWNTEFLTRWDQQVGGLREVAMLLKRDMHDAIGSMRVAVQNEDKERDSSANSNKLDVRFGLQVKVPGREATGFGASNVTTLRDRSRLPALGQ